MQNLAFFRDGRRAGRVRGFTIVELLVVMVIAAILLAAAVPSMHRFLINRGIAAKVEAFSSGLRYARSEALKRGDRVSMCMTTDPTATSPACATAASQGWQSGWLVFVDRNGNGTIDTGEIVLRREQPSVAGGGITGSVVYITFQPNGLSQSGAMSVQFLDVSGTGLGKLLCVSNIGRTAFATGSSC